MPSEIVQLIISNFERCVEKHFDLPELHQVVDDFDKLQHKKKDSDNK